MKVHNPFRVAFVATLGVGLGLLLIGSIQTLSTILLYVGHRAVPLAGPRPDRRVARAAQAAPLGGRPHHDPRRCSPSSPASSSWWCRSSSIRWPARHGRSRSSSRAASRRHGRRRRGVAAQHLPGARRRRASSSYGRRTGSLDNVAARITRRRHRRGRRALRGPRRRVHRADPHDLLHGVHPEPEARRCTSWCPHPSARASSTSASRSPTRSATTSSAR